MSSKRGGLTQRSVAGALWTGLSAGAEGLMQILALMLLARSLQPEEFGLFAATLVVVGFSTIFSGLGVGPAIVQRADIETRHIRVGFTASILLSLLVAGLIWSAAPVLAAFFRMPGLQAVIRVAAVVFVLQGLVMVAQALAQRALRFRWLATVHALAFLAGFVIVAPMLAWLGLGVWALIGALVVQNVTQAGILLVGQPHTMRPQLNLKTLGELVYFGSGFTLARVGNFLAGQADKLVLGRFLGAQHLGFYVLASQIVTAPAVLVGQVMDRVLFPTMARVQFEPARLARAYRSGVSVCALATLPLAALVVLLADELVEIMLGPKWIAVATPLQILATGMLFRTSYKLSDSVARATGAVYARAWRQWVYAGAILVMALLGQAWGLPGVAFGVVAAVTANFFLMAHLSLRLTQMTWRTFGSAHLPGLALATLSGAVIWLVADALRGQHEPAVIIVLAATSAAGAVALLMCKVLPRVFLGADAQDLIVATISMAPQPMRTSLLWFVEKERLNARKDDLGGAGVASPATVACRVATAERSARPASSG